MIHNLVISGGATKSIAVIGCLQHLEELKVLDGVMNVVGTSAGAILAFLLVLGYAPSEILAVIKNTFVGKDYYRLRYDDLMNLDVLETFGLDSGQNFMGFLREVVEEKLGAGVQDVTFLELTKRFGKNLVVCVANVSRRATEYMCVDDSPDMSVLTAIRMSMSLPVLFSPVRHNDDLYVDGALYESLPIGYIRRFKDTLRDTLAIRTRAARHDVASRPIGDIGTYLATMISSLMEKVNRSAAISLKIKVFDVDVQSENMFGLDLDELNFKLDDAEVDAIAQRGYDAFKSFFEKQSP